VSDDEVSAEQRTPAVSTDRPRLKLDLDLVPEQTSDDLASSWGDASPDDAAKRQNYLAEKPPHHGD
jgi:hypothetical protein